MQNRIYVRNDDIVLVNLFVGMNQDDRGIISYRYSTEQVRDLLALPTDFLVSSTTTEQTSFEFI